MYFACNANDNAIYYQFNSEKGKKYPFAYDKSLRDEKTKKSYITNILDKVHKGKADFCNYYDKMLEEKQAKYEALLDDIACKNGN